jgi:tryptophanyl-tRNA synthetase
MTKNLNSQTIVLTGDRPTGRLHLGHYVGSIQNRVRLQDESDKAYYMVADVQALTDNADNPEKVRSNVLEVVLDNLACGVDPSKTTFFLQSQIPEIAELTVFFMNLVTVQQLSHNPTIKSESKERGFNLNTKFDDEADTENTNEQGMPLGFLAYPVSQTADILAFKANAIPVGIDQLPVIEQANKIANKFNAFYGEVFGKINHIMSDVSRLVGTDGNAKMSKSLGNCIYLSDSYEQISKQVMSMYTDPNHLRVEDPGQVEGNVVFTYLDIFDSNKDEVEELKNQYRAGGLGDVVIKKRLIDVLENIIKPIREKRESLAQDMSAVEKILEDGTNSARSQASLVMGEVKTAMKINYFNK